MRQLLNTLFVLSEDAYLSVNGENVVISREQKEVARFPLQRSRAFSVSPTPAQVPP